MAASSDEAITWLLAYDGRSSPQAQGWAAVGRLAANARLSDGALHIVDDSPTEFGAFRATWPAEEAAGVIVEATVCVRSVEAGPRGGPGPRWGTMIHPALEGAPAGILISDGRHQQGLALCVDKVSTFLDRLALMDTRTATHTYRIEIQGQDMKIYVNGDLKIRGERAFALPVHTSEPFVQFGSNSPLWKGDSEWSLVRLGIRRGPPPPKQERLRVKVGSAWEIPPTAAASREGIRHPHGPGVRHTRPFVHNLGRRLLIISVAQGPDAVFEPYGLLKSTDDGLTWVAIEDIQLKHFAPQTLFRLPGPGGEILGVSRWTVKYQREDGHYVGMTYRFDPEARRFSMHENHVRMPTGMGPSVMFSRDMFALGDGSLLASVYCATAENKRRSFLLQSMDRGLTWTHYSTMGSGAEPSVVQLSPLEMTAILRTGDSMPFVQVWSRDAGRTWSDPVQLEEGSVDPDMTLMSNGVLVCSYGRPGSNIMFSLDGGRTWEEHRTIEIDKGFNYTAIREVSPGRLLFVHDAPKIKAMYIDVERLK